MADMFADNLVKKVIRQITDNKNNIPSNEIAWKSMTRRMFHHH